MNPRRLRRIREVLGRRQPDLTVLMEKVNKSHNFSAVLRNCDAVGILEAHAVLPEKDVPLHAHVSAGTAKWVRVRTHPQVEKAVEHLHSRGFRVLAAHPEPEALDFRDVDYSRPVAVMVGAELEGISPEGLALADEHLMIPMAGMARSFNVSVATALILFEAYRQRSSAGLYERSRLPKEEFERILFEWCHPEIAAAYRARGLSYPGLSSDGEALLPPGGLSSLPPPGE